MMRTIAAPEVLSGPGRDCGSALEPWLIVILFVSLAAGIFLRFHNVAGKPCWYDECYSRVRIAGFDHRDLVKTWTSCRKPIPVQEVKAFMHCRFKRDADLPWRSILREDFQNCTLYYWLARVWVGLFGETAGALRFLSIVVSILSLPLMFMLCRELFGCKRTAAVTLSILASSPVFVIYAQQIRHYDIWIATVLVASLMLLRAVRQSTFWNWAGYALSLALCFLANPLSLSFALGHAIFVCLKEGMPLTSQVKAVLASGFVASLALLPRVILSSYDCVTRDGIGWLYVPPPGGLQEYLWLTVFRNSSRMFWQSAPFAGDACLTAISLLIVCVLIWAMVHLVKNGSREQMLFVGTLVFASLLALVCRDALVTGRAATVTRYLFPTLAGLLMAVGFLFASKIAAGRQVQFTWLPAAWRVGLTAVILATLQASFQLASAQATWASWPEVTESVPDSVRLINQVIDPVVLVPCAGLSSQVLVLADQLRSDARIIPICDRPELWLSMFRSELRSGRDVFLWDPLHKLVERLRSDPELVVNTVEPARALSKIELSPYKADLPMAGKTPAN